VGNDVLAGGAGDDRIVGGPGRDVMSGGPGADVFIFGPGDRIVDFEPGVDRAQRGAPPAGAAPDADAPADLAIALDGTDPFGADDFLL
jgi:Ca2+-binding RTX toxin-like protein